MINYNYTDGLESERLKTRFLTKDDITPWVKFTEDPDCTEFFGAWLKGNPLEDATAWINKQQERYRENRFGLQAILDKKTGEFLGQCGLLLQDIDGELQVEIGYSFFKQHWGKGYATEAHKLFKDYITDNAISDSVISIIDVNNTNSQAVALRNNFTKGKRLLWQNMDVFIFRYTF